PSSGATTHWLVCSNHHEVPSTTTPALAATSTDGTSPPTARTACQGSRTVARQPSLRRTPRSSLRSCSASAATPTVRTTTSRTSTTTAVRAGYRVAAATTGTASARIATGRRRCTGRAYPV